MKIHKGIIGAVSFLAGIVVGYIAAEKYLRPLYDQKTREAVKSVKEAYRPAKQKEPMPDDMFSTEAESKSPETEGVQENIGKEDPIMAHKEPYEISPQEFGSRKGYDSEQMICCADGIIAYRDGEIVEDAESLVGEDIHELIANADGESVFIRNDDEQCDYEIVPDERGYYDIPDMEPFDPEDL